MSHIGFVNDVNQSKDNSPSGDTMVVPIRDEMIRLGQLLKLAGVVDDGAQARGLIEDGEVRVDGEVERRRGRQVHPGSTVELGMTRIRVTST
jgi:ribosome-associated protein